MSWGAWGRHFNSIDMQRQIESTVGLGISTFDHAIFMADILQKLLLEPHFLKPIFHALVFS